MKPTHSNLVGEATVKGKTVPLLISSWEESSFSLTVDAPVMPVNRLEIGWEDIDAVGAADDASRFQILEFPEFDFVRSCP